MATVEVSWVQTEFVSNGAKYESPNAVYQSDGHPIFMIFCCFRILQQS